MRAKLLGLALVAFFAVSGLAAEVHAAKCTLMPVKSAKAAALRVYFTQFKTEDKTGGKYKKCAIVKKRVEGTQAFFVTPFRQDATVVVHRSNWPR